MKIDRVGRFAILQGSLLELPQFRPLEVGSAGGTVWLTLDNDPRDLMIDAGERTIVEVHERILAYALDDAVLEVRVSPASNSRSSRVSRIGFTQLLQPNTFMLATRLRGRG